MVGDWKAETGKAFVGVGASDSNSPGSSAGSGGSSGRGGGTG